MRGRKKPEEYRDSIPLGDSFKEPVEKEEIKVSEVQKEIPETKRDVKETVEEVSGTVVNESEIPDIPNVPASKVEEEKKRQDPKFKKKLTDKDRLRIATEEGPMFDAALSMYSEYYLGPDKNGNPRGINTSQIIVPVFPDKNNGGQFIRGSIGFAIAYHQADLAGTVTEKIINWMENHREIFGILAIIGYAGYFQYTLMQMKIILDKQDMQAEVKNGEQPS